MDRQKISILWHCPFKISTVMVTEEMIYTQYILSLMFGIICVWSPITIGNWPTIPGNLSGHTLFTILHESRHPIVSIVWPRDIQSQSARYSVLQQVKYEEVPKAVYKLVYRSVYEVVYQAVFQAVCQAVYQTVCQSVCRAVYQAVYQAVCQVVCQSICLTFCQTTYQAVCSNAEFGRNNFILIFM